MEERSATIYVGIDWASKEHRICMHDASGRTLREWSVAHSGEGLADLSDRLREAAGGDPSAVWVSIEVPHGPVVEVLLSRGFRVFAINPKQLDRFRDRFTVAGAKDDRRDAHVLAHCLRTDAPLFRELAAVDPAQVRLRQWGRTHDRLVRDRVALENTIREELGRYFPQYLELTGDVGRRWVLDLWEKIPTPEKAAQVLPRVVERILRSNRVRSTTAQEVLTILRRRTIEVGAATVEACVADLELLVAHLRFIQEQTRHCEKSMDALLKQMRHTPTQDEAASEEDRGRQSDAEILQSIPGVGRIVLATLLAEAAEQLRQRDYQTVRMLAGVAPVTQQSGKSRSVLMRRACNQRMSTALYHWARVAAVKIQRFKEMYARHRARGKSHGRALRALADRLLKMAFAMLRDGTLYDPNHSTSNRPTNPVSAGLTAPAAG